MRSEWSDFVSQLPTLLSSRVPRYMNTARGSPCVFCDTSIRGYSAVVYLRISVVPHVKCVFLVATKTELALPKSSSVPRLELNAAVLLARRPGPIKSSLEQQLAITDVCAWTDSSTVLSWSTIPQNTFKVYVSNRNYQIQTLLPDRTRCYVKSDSNPADCA